MENPMTWGPLERAIQQARLRHSMHLKRDGSVANTITRALYYHGFIHQHKAEEVERLVSRKLGEYENRVARNPGWAGLSFERQLADALRDAKLVEEQVRNEVADGTEQA